VRQFLSTMAVTDERQWGGKRAGAGRKASPVVRVTLKVPRELWAHIQRVAQMQGQAPEEVAAQWLQEQSSEATDST
jgi:hypothetical protein